MSYVAQHKNARMSARKVRLVLDAIRGKNANQSLEILDSLPKRAAYMITKVVKSAVANAVEKDDPNVDDLFISKAFADEGPTIHRFIARAQGRATPIRKRTSHITIELSSGKE